MLQIVLKRVVRRAGKSAFATRCTGARTNERRTKARRTCGRTDDDKKKKENGKTHDVPGTDPTSVLQEQLHDFNFSVLTGDVQQRSTVLVEEKTEEDDDDGDDDEEPSAIVDERTNECRKFLVFV